MSWLDGFSKNWAKLDETSADPELRPVRVPLPPPEAVSWAVSEIAAMGRWTVLSADPERGSLHATHQTLLWRFVDDVRLQFQTTPVGGTIITAQSRSRIGKVDLGQNARNLRELTRLLRAAVPVLESPTLL